MKTIKEKINFFKENLNMFDDDMDKYKYLLLWNCFMKRNPLKLD